MIFFAPARAHMRLRRPNAGRIFVCDRDIASAACPLSPLLCVTSMNTEGIRLAQREVAMKTMRSAGRVMLRMTPLASCLALSFAIAGVTSEAWAVDHRTMPSRSVPPDARIEPSLLDAWIHEPIDRQALQDHWRAVLQRPVPALPLDSIPVTNCNDSGAGSLRDAVNNANNGDTIDLTDTGCSTITLTTGAIAITQPDLTLQGPGEGLSIDANHLTLALLHTGGGTLYVNDLTVKNGTKYFTDAQVDAARGGCIFSSGYVSLSHAQVKYCEASSSSTHYGVYGGAIYAQNGVTLDSSAVLGSSAHSTGYAVNGGGIATHGAVTLVNSLVEGNDSYSTTSWTIGGGVYARTGLSVKYSSIENNSAYSGFQSRGGGLYSSGNMLIENSTIVGNSSRDGGGVFVLGEYATSEITLLSSTISGNHAVVTGGIDIEDYPARVANSTIAFNSETFFEPYGAGLFVFNTNVELQSTAISNNYRVYGGTTTEDDVATTSNASFVGTLSGSHSLITLSSMTVPSGTIEGKYAGFAPLAYNGGSTATHKLLSFSPAINTGSNAANANYDQRGDGFPRVIGANADIGAFELDTADEIFSDGFDR
jgi:hypothetical protein